MRQFLNSIDISKLIGLRERAMIAHGLQLRPRRRAVTQLKVGDYYIQKLFDLLS